MIEKNNYNQEIIEKMSKSQLWPKIDNTDLIIHLIRIADSQYKLQTIEGVLSSVLIYQQVLEEYLLNLLRLSNFYVQAEILPTQINLSIRKKLMFGQLLDEHKRTILFSKKEELLNECRLFNETRIKFVHNLLKFQSINYALIEAKNLSNKFYIICDFFWEGRDFIYEKLKDLQNTIDLKYVKS